MRQRHVFLCILFLLTSFTACGAGHLGTNEVAFVRAGHLWTIDPNGSNAFELVAQTTPVVGYSWSPTHQLLVFRTLDEQFAKKAAAQQLALNPITGQSADSPSTVNTLGIDGGSAIPIMLSSPDVQYSNPVWNATGTRLIYRQEPTATHTPKGAFWWASQNDQPGGIAARSLPSGDARLSLSYVDASAIGTTTQGIFTVSLTGTNRRIIVSGPLSGHPLPAALERILWQPAHPQPLLLYAKLAPPSTTKPVHQGNAIPTVQLVTRSRAGQEKVLATCACTQFAWSPDGNTLLYSTGTQDTFFNVMTGTAFTLSVEGDSVPYWSPNSRFLLLDGLHSLQMVQLDDQQQRTLLSDGATPASDVAVAGINALLQPAPNSLWAADSGHFLFLTRTRSQWQGNTLSKGLYTVTIDAHGQPQGAPVVVDTGNDTQAGWTYQDENTSFLY